MRLPNSPLTDIKHIYNPLLEDFKVTYANDDNEAIEYICPSRQISSFPEYLANHIAKHLAQKMVFEKSDWPQKEYEGEYNRILKEIMVNI